MNHIAYHLRNICLGKQTGLLTFKRASVQKQLFFQDGDLVNAKTSVPEERLGEILFKLGKISDDAHSQLERYLEPHQAIGKTLTQKGLTSQRNVDDGLTYQMKEIALSLFPHFDADIAFQQKPSLARESFSRRINVPYLIEDGIRRMKLHPDIQRNLAKKTPIPKDRTFHHLLTQEEKEMLDKITGEAASDALWRSLKYNPEFFWKSLYLFYCLNLIDFKERKEVVEERQPEPQPSSPEADEQLEEILTFKEKLPTMNYYQILSVAKTASDEDIKKAYFLLARKYHPDRFSRSLPRETRVMIEEIFDQITKAYRILTSRDERKGYDANISAAPERSPKDPTKLAETKFRQAKTLFSREMFEEALILLEEAIRLRKNKGDYYLLLAMTEARIPAFRRKAEEHFLKAQEMEPWNPEAYVGLGVLYKQEGMTTKATKQFEKALEYDGDHEIARRELGGLGKGEKKSVLKSLLSMNIFGSKKK
jgi:tetratricopeptide (TPR) repeat protein